MSDFEVHDIGTATELRLSRQLVNEIKQVGEQYGFGLFPSNVLNTYKELIAFYSTQQENERYSSGI